MYEYLIRDLRDPNKPIDCNEVADAIEELSKPRWIPVTEPPKEDE